jgi:hypothetical protein
MPSDDLLYCTIYETLAKANYFNPKNAFINVGLFFENRQEARKLGLLPLGKSFEAVSSDWSRRSVRSVFSRDNLTLMISIALFGLIAINS